VPPDTAALWWFLPWGYLFTVAVELPVLLVGLAPRHSLRDRLVAGLALTAFTYPIVICVLPPLVWEPWGRTWYLAVAERPGTRRRGAPEPRDHSQGGSAMNVLGVSSSATA
jgi:hypothetical protein